MNRRPQEPVPPFPYIEEEVSFLSGELEIAGTLTLPGRASTYPAIVLVHGSAAHMRNTELNGHKPFLLLSDYYTRRGFVVLRYDKRGNGNSSGDFTTATTLDLSEDASAAVEFLQAHPCVDNNRIAMVGHSEGGMIAALVASRSRVVAAIVTLGAPCVPCDQMMLTQTEAACRASGMPETRLVELLERLKQLYSVAKAGGAIEDLIALLPDQNEAARARIWSTPWGRCLLGYDPRPALSRVRCPILALYAEKDTQVITSESIVQARNVLCARTDVEVVEIPGVNHYFQTCWAGARNEYQILEETFSPVVMSKIGDFLETY